MSASRVLGLIITSSGLLLGCSSAKKIELGGTCILNSDCNSSLVCTAGKCHDACHVSTDCPAEESCIIASDQLTVCQLPVESHCAYNSDCQPPLICGGDQKCRNQCQANVDCTPGQICTTTKTCAEPNQVDSNNNLIGTDGGVGGSGGASGTGGSGGGGEAEAGVPDAPGAEPDVSMGGVDGGRPGTGGMGGTDVIPGTGIDGGGTDAGADISRDVGAPDAPVAQDAPAAVDGGCSTACTGNTPVCLNGACVACSPGDTTGCVSNSPATCSTTGAWVANALACVNQTCLSGSCQGKCAPGQALCVSSAQTATCSSTGTLQNLTDCGSGQCINGTCEPSPPSCPTSDAGISGCGSSNESCCTSLEVPGGTYYRTYTYDADGGTGLADPATVSGFRLDKYLVTVGRFRQFVNAWKAGWLPSGGSGIHTHLNGGKGLAIAGSAGAYESGWNSILWNSYVAPTDANLSSGGGGNSWTTTAGSQENLPITSVNWYEAYAFCIWDGGFLPSEAEWEYAAAGGSDQREYPWGSADPGNGCQYDVYGRCYPGGIAPVGAAMAGVARWGQLDMAGNVWEWNLDTWDTYANPSIDCTQLNNNSRVIRGGAYWEYLSNTLPTYRWEDDPTGRGNNGMGPYGLRCARIP